MNKNLYIRVLDAMGGCPQNDKQSVLEHCKAVRDRSIVLWDYLTNSMGIDLSEFRIPKWFLTYHNDLFLDLAPFEVMTMYTEMHDCGKPYCRVISTENCPTNEKEHFPDHANVSANIWGGIDHSPFGERVENLIRHDMDFHVLKLDRIEEFCKIRDCQTLMVVALAEIHANAEMFGGIDSTGFKIKFAQIERRGKAVCEKLYGKIIPG